MKLIVIPPYLNPVVNWQPVDRELLSNLEKKGQLKEVEVNIDEGYFIESPSESRDEEFLANITIGMIRKVKEYSGKGEYDAIVIQGVLGPGFAAARAVSKIPVTGQIHSAIHMASLIGERFGVIHTVVPSSLIIKHRVEEYGFGHKLASVRFIGHSSTYLYKLIRTHKKGERIKVPEIKKVIDDMTAQCIAAIEKDRADTLIFGCEPLQIFEDEVRQSLDESGYSEIPIICELSAGVEMAKAMVNMKLIQAAKAYPTAALKAKPEYW